MAISRTAADQSKATWVLVSTIVSDVLSWIRKDHANPWQLPLEIFNTCLLFVAFVVAAVFAAGLKPYCVPLNGVWSQAKELIPDLASKLSKLIHACPLTKAGAAFCGLAL